jgi:hypothetical protein
MPFLFKLFSVTFVMFWNAYLMLSAVVKFGRAEGLIGRTITYNQTTALLPFCGQQQNIFGS